MSKLKFSFLVLMLMVSVSASADWAPADVQAALKKMYPTVDDVAWSHDESYYVADFLMNGFDTKVWFDGQAQWVMQQTDWRQWTKCPLPFTMLLPPVNIPEGWCRMSLGYSFPNGSPSWR